MGQTAASGGYWIAMYGKTIYAGPTTLTGSIGVIGGWVWDEGFGDKLGMSSDVVKRGKHADLWQGITLPLLNITVPARPLTAEERLQAEKIILQLYDDFVGKVAEARGFTESYVRDIAEGRTYSGKKAESNKLIDALGGIARAIDTAVLKAELHKDEDIALVEYPDSKGLLNIKNQLSPVSIPFLNSNVADMIRLFSENAGQPLPLLLPGNYPTFEQ
jgi:protease-4